MNLWAKSIIIPCLIIFGLNLLIHLSTPNIPEIDSFFYIKLAQEYKNGITNTAFSQLPLSTLGNLGSSLWYGFGVTLIPFTLFKDPVFGLKIAGIISTTLLLGIFFWAIKKEKFVYPWGWLGLFIFSAPNILYRLGMTRPQTISVAFSILLAILLLKEAQSTKTLRLQLISIFTASFAISWIHFNFIWLPILIGLVITCVSLILEKSFAWKNLLAVFLGTSFGWIARPHALDSIKLFYVQIIKLITEKQSGLPLLFGSENLPLSSATLIKNFGIILLFWLIGIIWYGFVAYKSKKSEKRITAHTASLFILSAIFFGMTMIVARKAYDFWVAFGILFLISALKEIREKSAPHIKNKIESSTKISLIIALVILIPYSGLKTLKSFKETASTPDRYREEGEWIAKDSNAGDLVFNANWSNFSPLFFWNNKNRYTSGLDPIFLYDYSPEFYWKFHYISAGILTDKTCGKIECRLDELEDTYTVIKENFKAKYVFVDKNQNPDFLKFLESDTRFKKGIETDKAAVFKLL
ncbi:MAG: hypothetical protein COU07_03345 [Candidatus Harrisonbacteria bacterium CG10_big_fil_rev_8_21_14_0_10_40_38]|uniref:Glycosyltransferase RgtA/B/C/D-like domain-containing protein n=1 Tax=Candidatus Harrisonbacteria bacterium CG10_big_fil_rev_8_21_14_0_10_40_38 TaxID=1974583 RepID=A0A2H0UTD3_9BACT|nr:MAG: hypothetical protein COU07_03345 [Candidatus Harrisonbacteria bacterium CG10_big_fil_rev_8_21_14_0_10_40_38]